MIARTQKTEFVTTFNDAASAYDESRPEYCRELYHDLLAYQPIGPQCNVLEIGMGTGKATGPILETQCRLTALEPGAELAGIARRKLGQHENLFIEEKTLQEYECPDETFDLIYAATAFHWIPEEYGYRRVYHLLRKGGVFARFAYHAGEDLTRKELSSQIRRAYSRCSAMAEKKKQSIGMEALRLAQTAERYGFTDTACRFYEWTKDFTADAYMKLLSTYPDHMALPDMERKRLFAEIHHAIQMYGGIITVHYTADMQLARRPETEV